MEDSNSTLKTKLVRAFNHPLVIIGLILVNLFWGILGIIAYIPQTTGVSLLFWIFIPDCPLYTTLFALFLMDREKVRKDMQPFLWVMSMSMIKFSLVAPSLYYIYPQHYHAPPVFGITLPNIYPFDYFHLILLIQGLFISAVFLIRSVRNFLIGFSWILLNDFVDFFFLTFPYYYLARDHMLFFMLVYLFVNIAIFVLGIFILSKNELIRQKLDTFYYSFERIFSSRVEQILASRFIRQRK